VGRGSRIATHAQQGEDVSSEMLIVVPSDVPMHPERVRLWLLSGHSTAATKCLLFGENRTSQEIVDSIGDPIAPPKGSLTPF
jgi:hypothetical protein